MSCLVKLHQIWEGWPCRTYNAIANHWRISATSILYSIYLWHWSTIAFYPEVWQSAVSHGTDKPRAQSEGRKSAGTLPWTQCCTQEMLTGANNANKKGMQTGTILASTYINIGASESNTTSSFSSPIQSDGSSKGASWRKQPANPECWWWQSRHVTRSLASYVPIATWSQSSLPPDCKNSGKPVQNTT